MDKVSMGLEANDDRRSQGGSVEQADEDDEWLTDFDDENEGPDRFDLGIYAGALR